MCRRTIDMFLLANALSVPCLVLFRSCVISQSTICHFNMSVSHIFIITYYYCWFFFFSFILCLLAYGIRYFGSVLSGELSACELVCVCVCASLKSGDNIEFKTSINAMGRIATRHIISLMCFWTHNHSFSPSHTTKKKPEKNDTKTKLEKLNHWLWLLL